MNVSDIIKLYFKKRTKELFQAAWISLAALILYLVSTTFPEMSEINGWVVAFLVGFMLLTLLNIAALTYRVSRNLFGTTEFEAREIIAFIRSNNSLGSRIFKPTLVYFKIEGEWRLLIGPKKLLESIGGANGFVFIEKGDFMMTYSINANIALGDNYMVNGVPFSEMQFK